MRIGIDARFLTHPQPGGFKTYTENLISVLADIDAENRYVLYVDRLPNGKDKIPFQPNFEICVVSVSLPIVGLPWREQVSLKRAIAKDKLDLFHAPCLTAPLYLSCPLVLTVHDMIWAFPVKYSRSRSLSIKRRLMEWYNYLVPKYAIRQAASIITVSQAAKESIVQYLGLSPDQIHVTYEAAGSSFRRIMDPEALEKKRSKRLLPENFILAIGSADPRKNIKTLLHAYSLLSEELRNIYHLVIVWTHSFLTDEFVVQINHLGIHRTVQFLQNVSDDELAALYNSTCLFVFPSLYEGFGLPPLEAMSCGAPVVAANNSSIPEIVGNAALFFDAQDAVGMSKTIQNVLTDKDIVYSLRNDGLKRSTQFSWEKCGIQTLAVYTQVLSKEL